MRRGQGVIVVAGVAAALWAPAQASAVAAAPKPPRLAVVNAGRKQILKRGTLRVVLESSSKQRLRLAIKGLTKTQTVALTPKNRRRARTIVALPLSAAGRAAFGRCAAVEATATARGARTSLKQSKTFKAPRPCVPAGFTQPTAEKRYLVGAASRSISPGADGKFGGETVYLGGYGLGASRPATGVLGDGPSVRAFTVSDGRTSVAIADIEAQGWFAATKDGPYGLVDVRRAVAKRTGGALSADRVIVQSDHSHAGIDAMGVWGGMPAAYRKFVLDRTTDAIVAAFESSRAGRLYYGTTDGRDLLSNQFDYDEANKVVDSEVRVLQARDDDGKPFATLLNFSAHPTVLGSSNTKASGDWVQQANPLLEKRLGGTAVTMVGTLGRTQPADRGCADKALTGDAQSLCSLDEYATRVVDRAQQAVDAAKPIDSEPLVAARSYLVQDLASSPLLLGLLYAGGVAEAPVNRSITPPYMTGNVIGTTTASVRIGDVLLSAVPGEAYPQIALKVRELVPGLRGYMTAGLADDQLGYLIAPYEAYPEPVKRTFFNERGDEVSPIDNDNYAFNVSQTMGERVTCSLLRGAGELAGKGTTYRAAYDRCTAFVNDLANAPGADVK